ncbi:unnamed protein product [Linum trigynum]|uniref:Uncharacterized protein n=1 Tax=Linum trigynum TaxID=586398 RepID=A0AAV2F3F7_9ROSI
MHHPRKVETSSSGKLSSDQQHSRKVETDSSKLCLDSRSDDDRNEELKKVVLDLSKDDFLTQLRWKSSRKRRRGPDGGGTPASDLNINQKNKSTKMSLLNIPGPDARLLISNALSIDHDNRKYTRDLLFASSAVQPLTSLVMSR